MFYICFCLICEKEKHRNSPAVVIFDATVTSALIGHLYDFFCCCFIIHNVNNVRCSGLRENDQNRTSSVSPLPSPLPFLKIVYVIKKICQMKTKIQLEKEEEAEKKLRHLMMYSISPWRDTFPVVARCCEIVEIAGYYRTEWLVLHIANIPAVLQILHITEMRWDVGFDRRAGVLPSNIRIHSGINVAAMLQIFSAALNFTAARGSFHSEKTRGKKEREKERKRETPACAHARKKMATSPAELASWIAPLCKWDDGRSLAVVIYWAVIFLLAALFLGWPVWGVLALAGSCWQEGERLWRHILPRSALPNWEKEGSAWLHHPPLTGNFPLDIWFIDWNWFSSKVPCDRTDLLREEIIFIYFLKSQLIIIHQYFVCVEQMKRGSIQERCWSTVTREYHALRRWPSPTWCDTRRSRWWRPTRWWSSGDPSSRPISTSWANCWNSNRVCGRLTTPSRPPPTPTTPPVAAAPSTRAATSACSIRAGPNNPHPKWNLAAVFELPFVSLPLSLSLSLFCLSVFLPLSSFLSFFLSFFFSFSPNRRPVGVAPARLIQMILFKSKFLTCATQMQPTKSLSEAERGEKGGGEGKEEAGRRKTGQTNKPNFITQTLRFISFSRPLNRSWHVFDREGEDEDEKEEEEEKHVQFQSLFNLTKTSPQQDVFLLFLLLFAVCYQTKQSWILSNLSDLFMCVRVCVCVRPVRVTWSHSTIITRKEFIFPLPPSSSSPPPPPPPPLHVMEQIYSHMLYKFIGASDRFYFSEKQRRNKANACPISTEEFEGNKLKKEKKKAKQFPDQTKQFFSVKKITKNKTNKYICSNNDDNKEV